MKEFTKSYGIKRVAELTEEVKRLNKWLDFYRKNNKEIMAAYTDVCDDFASYIFDSKRSTELQIHYLKMARKRLEEEENGINPDSRK